MRGKASLPVYSYLKYFCIRVFKDNLQVNTNKFLEQFKNFVNGNWIRELSINLITSGMVYESWKTRHSQNFTEKKLQMIYIYSFKPLETGLNQMYCF